MSIKAYLLYIVFWVILRYNLFIGNVQEIFEDRQKEELKLKTKLEVQETTINEKTVEIDDLKSILGNKEGI